MKSKKFLAVSILLFLCAQPLLLSQGFLHTQGIDIIDDTGNKILLRGVGLGNWMLPEGYMWKFGNQGDRPRKIEKIVSDLIGEEDAATFWRDFRSNYITENDIRRMAELGFNSVRPALNSRLFVTEGPSPEFVDEGFRLLDSLISWCRKYHVYVIIDMHGAPGGQTGANIDDSRDDQPGLFMDRANQDLLVELWVRIAGRYKDEPTVAAYDLLNEPLPENTGAADKYGQQLEPLYKRITHAIRETDSNHMITLEGMNWANNWSIFTGPFDKNLFYQFHYYCWNEHDNLNDIQYFLNLRKKFNVPVWIGETGESNTTIYWGTTQNFEQNNMGWSFWPWKKMDTRNTPYSINEPAGWDAVIAYSKGGAKPSREAAKKAFDMLIENIKLDNCVYYPDVVNSLFHRLPVDMQAENYGHSGLNTSYFVNDTSFRSENYRKRDPVPIVLLDNSKDGSDGQFIRLKEREWTGYEVAGKAEKITGLLRARAPKGEISVILTINGKDQELVIPAGDWQDIDFETKAFHDGLNTVKVMVEKGVLELDFISL